MRTPPVPRGVTMATAVRPRRDGTAEDYVVAYTEQNDSTIAPLRAAIHGERGWSGKEPDLFSTHPLFQRAQSQQLESQKRTCRCLQFAHSGKEYASDAGPENSLTARL